MADVRSNERAPAAALRRGWSVLSFALSLPLLALLWIYRRFVSPVLPAACRYYPSCSHYAVDAVRLRGPFVGPWLALRRLLRCHPWSPGGHDPVPLKPGRRPVDPLSKSIEAGSVPAGASAQRIA
jgi:putative membrane protein insertion efficiency factor